MEGKKSQTNKEEKVKEEEEEERQIPFYKKREIFGQNSSKKKNFLFIEKWVTIYISGMSFKILNFESMKESIYHCKGGGGIGCIEIHPDKNLFAVGEKGQNPKIYIYSYPQIKSEFVLENGTERSFSCLAFTKDGKKLASVGNRPDFSLIIWNWREKIAILKVKAFSQEIYDVGFSEFDDSSLCTVGMAHIKFWKIAKTFTGLKLKGEIGKFGQIELSDITAFAILESGKVVSGSDSGNILLWEGNFIKAVLRKKNSENCHLGIIESIKIINKKYIISAGADCFIKVWDLEEIDNIIEDEDFYAEIDPLTEIQLTQAQAEDFHIINIQTLFFDEGVLFLQNSRGSLVRVDLDRRNFATPATVQTVYSFADGKITDAVVAKNHVLLAYEQGVVVTYKHHNQTSTKLLDPCGVTCITFQKENIVIGNKKGVIKIFDDKFKKINLVKVFDEPIEKIFTENSFLICVAKNQIFVLKNSENKLIGQYLYRIKKGFITSTFLNNLNLYIGVSTGEIFRIKVKEIAKTENEKDFEVPLRLLEEKKSQLFMALVQKPKQDENDIMFVLNDKVEAVDIEWDSLAIRSVVEYYAEADFADCQKNEKLNSHQSEESSEPEVHISESEIKINMASEEELLNKYIIQTRQSPNKETTRTSIMTNNKTKSNYIMVSSEGEYIGFVYILKMSKSSDLKEIVRPVKIIPCRKKIVTTMLYEKSGKFCLFGYEDGVIEIRKSEKLSEVCYLSRGHDEINGQVFFIDYDLESGSFMSIGKDCSLTVYDLKEEMEEEMSGVEKKHFSKNLEPRKSGVFFEKEEEILQGYSLQQEKIQAVEDKKKKNAEEHKKSVREKIELIRNQYEDLKNENKNLPQFLQLSEDQLVFDQKYVDFLKFNMKSKIDEAEKEVEFDKTITEMKLEKIKKFYLSDLSSPSFALSKIKKRKFVFSIKLKKITNFMIEELDKICKIIEGEKNLESSENIRFEEKIQTIDKTPIFKDFKMKFSENKNLNYFVQMKNKVKEECRVYQTIEKMREYKKEISVKIKELRKKEPSIKNVENSHEIIEAKKNFGDYILKTSENYKVGDDNRINVQNLQTQILLMEKFIYNSSKTFNNTLLQLKEKKKLLVEKIKKTNIKLLEINEVLGVKEKLYEFVFEERLEDPDSLFRVEDHEIEEYMCELEKKRKEEKQGIYGGMNEEEDEKMTLVKTDKNGERGGIVKVEGRKNRLVHTGNEKFKKFEEMKRIKLMSEKACLKSELEKEIEEFDRNVDWAIEERVKLTFELKMAEMKIMELYRDLLEVEIYENQDNELLAELIEQREILKNWNEKKTINATKLKKLEKKEQTSRTELETIIDKYKEKVFPSESEKSEFVYKYYKKHYKGNIEKENMTELDNSEDLEMMNSALENEKKEWVLTVEQNEEWLELLKKRRNAENTIRYFRDDKVLLDNECVKIEEKINQIQKNLNKIKNSLDMLQLVKQKKINKLSSSLILTLDQIFLNVPIADFDNIIMFTEEQFMRLNNRISELKKQCEEIENEKLHLIKNQEALTRELVLLRYSKKKSLEELKENFHLKFGKVIDLKILDSLKQTKRLKELKQKLKEIEKNCSKKIEDSKNSVQNTKHDLYELKKKNTGIIKKITALGSMQLKLNKTLDSTNKHIFKNEENPNKENVQNYRKDLLSIIKLLNNELDELKKEIILLKNKGTVI